MEFFNASKTRILLILCMVACLPLNSLTSDDELQTFCEERSGVLLEEKEICIYEGEGNSTWEDARKSCRFPDQNPFSDLFYMDNEIEVKFVLGTLLENRTENRTENNWWTAAIKVRDNKKRDRIIWRNVNVPKWLNRYNETMASSIQLMSLKAIRIGTNDTDVFLEQRSIATLTPLCRYSPSNGGIGGGSQITTIATTEATTLSTVKDDGCAAVNVSDVKWPAIDRNQCDQQRCPKGYGGNSTWCCSKNGDRNPSEIVYSECTADWIESVGEYTDPQKAMQYLAHASRDNNLLNKKSVNLINANMEYLLAKFQRYIDNRTVINTSKAVSTFVTNVVDTWDNLLNEFENIGWKILTREESVVNAQKAIINMEDSARMYGCHSLTGASEPIKSKETKDTTLQAFDVTSKQKVNFGSIKRTATIDVNEDLGKYVDEMKCKKKIVVGVASPNLASKLSMGNIRFDSITEVIGLSLKQNTSTKLGDYNVRITIVHGENNMTARCVFWDIEKNDWSSEGCKTVSSKKGRSECVCDHLTNFAFLMFAKEPPIISDPLRYITIISCGLSSVALVLTIICLAGFRNLRCRRTTITCNLCAALLMVNLLVLFGMDRFQYGTKTSETACFAVAAALHLFLVSAFMWMVMEAYLLYQMIVVVFTEVLNIKVIWFYVLGYGIPAIITAVSIGSRPGRYLSQSRYCWINNDGHGMIWSFLAPAYFIMFINVCVFVCAMKAAAEVKNKKNFHSTQALAASWLKRSFSITCLLGLTWTLGVFQEYEKKAFPYIFTVLNGLQGVFIFIFHVAMNEKSRTTILKYYKQHRASNVGASVIGDNPRIRGLTGGSFLSTNLKTGFTKSTKLRTVNSSHSSQKRISNSSIESQLSSRVEYT